jgi:bifunctional ADP-heptose synthase (sugar kinase/adenylyltransferase)
VATLAVALGGGASKTQASQLAILAGSIAVEQADTSLITAQMLKERAV